MTQSAQNPQKPASFADTENKSLEPQAEEAKAAQKATPRATPQAAAEPKDGVKVTMLHHARHGDRDLLAGRSYTLPADDAAVLLSARRARKA